MLASSRVVDAYRSVRRRFLADRGLDWENLDDATRAYFDRVLPAGDAEHFAQLLGPATHAGISGFTVALPVQYADPSAVHLAARTINAALS